MTLGYGDGDLSYIDENGKGYWEFINANELNDNDGLPEDAWIPFLSDLNSDKTYSTRLDFRPFNLKEQKTILLVGSCLTCHDSNSEIMNKSLETGIEFLVEKIGKNCILPSWK